MSGDRQASSVIVAGRDIDLWLTATALARALASSGVTVAAVELPTRLRPADIAATLPPLEALHAKLGIGEAEVLLESSSAFSFGQNFATGSAEFPPFFHAWGSYGRPVEDIDFFHIWRQARRQGLNVPLQGFCLTAVAAQNGRMLVPDQATCAFGRTDYGYHLHTAPYALLLKSIAKAHGVRMHEAQEIAVERRAEESAIAALLLDGGRRLQADLFVDASGADAVLLGGALGVAQQSWRHLLAAKRVLRARAPAFTSIPPFAEIRIGPHGWTALHPTRAATGIVHACDIGSDDEAFAAATAAAGIELADTMLGTVDPGIRESPWQANCIGVGEAACVFDPVHDVGIQALQLGIVHLLTLFPVSGDFTAERREYNRIMRSRFERIRDFQCALYALSPFDGPFWQRGRELQMPDTLRHRVATFRARGHIIPMEDETFLPDSWRVLFTGLGIVPESLPPTIGRISPQRLQAQINRSLELIRRKVLEQPQHDKYLESFGGGSSV
ncbi:MAG TPA: tryptophan 7-halogenase [Steroidobacteraceae bacterium]|nr:tryptophan 7-halogenase [Steroidobacteraceae bacterium]